MCYFEQPVPSNAAAKSGMKPIYQVDSVELKEKWKIEVEMPIIRERKKTLLMD